MVKSGVQKNLKNLSFAIIFLKMSIMSFVSVISVPSLCLWLTLWLFIVCVDSGVDVHSKHIFA